MRRSDLLEATANALTGLVVSLSLVWALRLFGLWDAPAWLVASFFFIASVGRSYVLRRLFRRAER